MLCAGSVVRTLTVSQHGSLLDSPLACGGTALICTIDHGEGTVNDDMRKGHLWRHRLQGCSLRRRVAVQRTNVAPVNRACLRVSTCIAASLIVSLGAELAGSINVARAIT